MQTQTKIETKINSTKSLFQQPYQSNISYSYAQKKLPNNIHASSKPLIQFSHYPLSNIRDNKSPLINYQVNPIGYIDNNNYNKIQRERYSEYLQPLFSKNQQKKPQQVFLKSYQRVSQKSLSKRIPISTPITIQQVKKKYEQKDFGPNGVPVFYQHPLLQQSSTSFLPLNTADHRLYSISNLEKLQIQNKPQNNLIRHSSLKNISHSYNFLPSQIPNNSQNHIITQQQNQESLPIDKNKEINEQSSSIKNNTPISKNIDPHINYQLQQIKINCIICGQSYSIKDKQTHKQIHKKRFEKQIQSLQNPIKDLSKYENQIKIKEYGKKIISQKNKTGILLKPIVQPQQCNVQYNLNQIILEKDVVYRKKKDLKNVSFSQDGVGTSGDLNFSFPTKQKESNIHYIQKQTIKPSNTSSKKEQQNKGNYQPAFIINNQQEIITYQSKNNLKYKSNNIKSNINPSIKSLKSINTQNHINQKQRQKQKAQKKQIKNNQDFKIKIDSQQIIDNNYKIKNIKNEMKRKMKQQSNNNPFSDQNNISSQISKYDKQQSEPIIISYDIITQTMGDDNIQKNRQMKMKRKLKKQQQYRQNDKKINQNSKVDWSNEEQMSFGLSKNQNKSLLESLNPKIVSNSEQQSESMRPNININVNNNNQNNKNNNSNNEQNQFEENLFPNFHFNINKNTYTEDLNIFDFKERYKTQNIIQASKQNSKPIMKKKKIAKNAILAWN